jgi:ATP-dependent DNA helicase RecQ
MAMAAAAAQLLRTARHPGADGAGRKRAVLAPARHAGLLDWLHDDARSLVNGPAIAAGLAGQPASPVRAMLDEAAAEYTRETGGADLPRQHFIEWLAEWGREARRRQSGLLLLTAHRAKGLEFDHVAVLDGGWLTGRDRQDGGADADAERRLYYVAMTRARLTLLLARFDRGHRLLDQLPAVPSLLAPYGQRTAATGPRTIVVLPATEPRRGGHRLCRSAGAGTPGASGHRRAGARHGAASAAGRSALAAARRAGQSGRPTRRQLHAAGRAWTALRHAWRRSSSATGSDSEPEYLARVRCQRWEVVLPELVFAPAIRRA